MNKIIAKLKFIGSFLLVAGMCFPLTNVWAAAETYTVTFRPGNVGYFAMTANPEGNRQDMAQAVAKQVYGNYDFEVTKNGAIKVTVPANAEVPNAPEYIQAETGYFVKSVSGWGPEIGQTADKNMDFVVDYGKLINGVEYTVEYVDSASGESIAPVFIAQANLGETRTETAPKQIVISDETVYYLTSEETLEKTLEEDAAQNVFTFRYTMELRETIEEEIINYIEGDTVVITETYTTRIDNGTSIIPAPAPTPGPADNGEVENGPDNVTIEDEQVPLAPSDAEEEENTGNVVNIDDEDVPLASFEEENTNNIMPIAAGVFAGAAIAAFILWLKLKKKKTTNAADSLEE